MTLGSHQKTVGKSQNHFTPKWIIDALGPFDLDPCAGNPRPWNCAKESWDEDGLGSEWYGRIWLNPPFDRYEVSSWIRKMAAHGNGTALLHARTETYWFEPVWDRAKALLFLADRLKFCRSDGSEQDANSGAPAVLCAFGSDDVERLKISGIQGYLIENWRKLP